MTARVEVYKEGRLIATFPAKSVEDARLRAEYERRRGFTALVVFVGA